MDDAAFLAAFESCELPKAAWTHRAHVRMAWLYLAAFAREAALDRARAGIQRYNASKGGPPSAYHETITCAYIRLVADRRAGRPAGESFDEFALANPDLVDREAHVLLRHYRQRTLFSDAARAAFVEPDVEPLPG